MSRFGATPAQPTAAAVAAQARANWLQAQAMAAVDRMNRQDTRQVEPARKVVETTEQIRHQVMAEHGLDQQDLLKLSAQARLEAEVSIERETVERFRHARPTGALLDIKV